MSSDRFVRDPDSVLDFRWDWSSWLAEDEVIDTASVTVAGVTKDDEENSTTTVTVWISGGSAGSTGSATCRITTNQGRSDDRTIWLVTQER